MKWLGWICAAAVLSGVRADDGADFKVPIKSGAVYPASIPVVQKGNHWSFQPIRKLPVPRVRGLNPVDFWLGTADAPTADARTLVRRITYDLTGLPPTMGQIDAFLRDCASDSTAAGQRTAVDCLVDRLLSSPAYGEKWGRKWLDVVRYADTAGENTDRPLHHAWRYRTYVIDSFNRDTPYDQFLREQIAGDLLAAEEPARHADWVAATGYLAIARRFGHDIEKDMHLTCEDVIDTVGKSVLGLTLGCARCHNHKYDPISARDYYGWYGIFASTQFAYPGCEPNQKARDMMPLWTAQELAAKRKPFEDELAGIDATLKRINDARGEILKTLRPLMTNAPGLLASGEFNDGGSQAFPSAGASLQVGVRTGEWLQLTVHPRANYGADTTILEWEIEEVGGAGGGKWNLAADVVADFLEANPHADRRGHPATWCFLDARKPLQFLTDSVRDLDGKAGLHVWRSGDNPSVFVNATDQPIKAWTTLPARTVFAHPASDGAVAVAWMSPISGTVRIHGRVADGHAGGGDGVAWRLEHYAQDFGSGIVQWAALSQELREPTKRRADRMAREPIVPVAYAVREGKPADAPLHKRGEPDQPGEIIPRKNLDLLGGEGISDAQSSGRRDLARWLTATNNPLTARVMVNRIWQGHFGRGLVATPNDFGTRGAAPVHPELLDWLAATFMEKGWSVKAMHRLILGSAAYQQAAAGSTSLLGRSGKDGNAGNVDLMAQGFPRRRLEAEEIRDTLLLLSGELDREPGRAHPFPPENSNFTQHTPFKAVYDTNKRSVYLMTQRIQKHPFLALFDGPDGNSSSPVRGNSTVPTQALYFLNDPFFHARAEAFARRLLVEPEDRRVGVAHRLVYQREPCAVELSQAAEFLAAYRTALADLPEKERDQAAWNAYSRTLLAANELLYVD